MPNHVTNGVLPPMMLHHVLLEFHLSFLGSLHGLLKLVQRHITLQTKGTPHLNVMCLEHPDDALVHRLRQRRGVRQQKDELDVMMQVLQHVGVGGSVVEDHQDTERGGTETCNTPSTRASRQSCCTPGKCVPSSNHWNWRTNGQAGWSFLSP